VRVLEQGTPGCGASHGNCGTITPSHAAPLAMPGTLGVALRSMLRADAPLYLNPRFDGPRLRWLLGFARHCNWTDFHRAATARSAILQRSRRLLGELVRDEALDCEFAEEGELYVYRSVPVMAADERHHATVLDRLGVEVRRLRGDAVEAMEPALKPGVVGGLFHPGDARLRPDRYVAELVRRVRELGGVIEGGARIEGFDVDGRRITQVRTSRGVWAAERVLLALGAWSPLLARTLGLRLPMQPGKGYSITYTRPARAPRHALVLREAQVCVTTWASGYRLQHHGVFRLCRRPQPRPPGRAAPRRGGRIARAGGSAAAGGMVGLAADERGRGADHRSQHALVQPAPGHGARHAGGEHVGRHRRAGRRAVGRHHAGARSAALRAGAFRPLTTPLPGLRRLPFRSRAGVARTACEPVPAGRVGPVCYTHRHQAEARISVVDAFRKMRISFSAGTSGVLLLWPPSRHPWCRVPAGFAIQQLHRGAPS